jgi:hypothetical protein
MYTNMEGYFNRMFSSKWLKVNGFNISIKVYKIQSYLLFLICAFQVKPTVLTALLLLHDKSIVTFTIDFCCMEI